MEVDEIKPLEEILEQVKCHWTKGNSEGIIIITSCRLIWKEANHAHFSVSVPRISKIKVNR